MFWGKLPNLPKPPRPLPRGPNEPHTHAQIHLNHPDPPPSGPNEPHTHARPLRYHSPTYSSSALDSLSSL